MSDALSGVHYRAFTVEHLLAHLEARSGRPFRDAAVASLPEPLRAWTSVASNKDWVPVEVYEGLVGYAARADVGDPLRAAEQLGFEVTLRDIHVLFRAVLSITSPRMVLSLARMVWNSYCDAGELVFVEDGQGTGVLTLHDFAPRPPMLIHEMAGGFRAFLHCSRAKDIRVELLPGETLRWRLFF